MDQDLATLTAQIVAAFAQKNRLAVSDLTEFIGSIHRSLSHIESPQAEAPKDDLKKPTPPQIRKSITREALISFEDGRTYKTLRRHLTRYGLTPADYRAKWGLPHDYPMVAPSYSEIRSALARSIGLGSKGRRATPPETLARVSPAPRVKRPRASKPKA
jgi:predicted transcriptional regulator